VKLLVIADDFTGANDTGVQFSKKGFNTVLSIYGPELEFNTQNCDVVVVDTESRFDNSEVAFNKVFNTVNKFPKDNIYIYKKLDSTLRGNIGSEIESCMDASKVNLAIVSPSFPKNGRKVVEGILYVNGAPVGETEISKDPKTPVTNSYIPDILKLQSNKKIGHIGLNEVNLGSEKLSEKIDEIHKLGYEIIVIDSQNDSELFIIADAIKNLKTKAIIAGSAGLAEFVSGSLIKKDLNLVDRPIIKEKLDGSFIVIAGSVSEVLRKQVEYSLKEGNFDVIDIDINNVINEKLDDEYNRILLEIERYIKQGKDIIIRSAKDRSIVDYAKSLGKSNGLSGFDVSEKIACFFGDLTREIYNKIKSKGIMLSGGDIAIKAATSLNIEGIVIKDEIAPGIPYGYFVGLENSNIPIITKAGSFGKEDAIIEVTNYFEVI
jgi:D-threonate/D-erythronate kinase